jgi:hypothetical protein
MALPENYAILEDTPPEEMRGGMTYVSRSLAEARGWIEPRVDDGQWFEAAPPPSWAPGRTDQ